MFVMTTGAVRFRLPEILKERGLKQIDLAEKMGVHKQTVSRLTGGVRQIDLDTLAKLCEALEVQVGDLLKYEPDETIRKST
jgi:putative transcriptional regulator